MLANLFGIEVCYYSYAPGESSRHNHKPQLYPQHRNHHDEVWKNVIPYALGLTRSIAYLRNCLVNRKTAIIVKMTLHVRPMDRDVDRTTTMTTILRHLVVPGDDDGARRRRAGGSRSSIP